MRIDPKCAVGPGFAKEENDRGSVAPLSQPRQGKPGFAERWRDRRAFETADGEEIINGSHHWYFTGLPLSFSYNNEALHCSRIRVKLIV